MVKIFYNKIMEMVKIREQKISELYIEKTKIEKQIKSIKEEKYNILYNSCYFDCDDSFKVILYLVSLIENEEYCMRKVPAILCDPSYFPGDGVFDVEYNYNFFVLVKKCNMDVKNSVDEKMLNFKGDRDDFKSLFTPNDDYVIIACLEKNFEKRICYMLGNNYNLGGTISYICDERYNYIVDFMDTVVDYRLDKPDLEVTFDEMKMLADEFVKNYKNNYENVTKKRIRNK